MIKVEEDNLEQSNNREIICRCK